MPRTDPDRPSRLITLAAICVVVAALYLASTILIPLALAVLFTFLLTPLVRRLERFRVPRVPSVLIVVLAAFAVFGFLAFVVGEQAVQLANNIDRYQDNIIAKLDVLRPRSGVFEKVSRFGEQVQKNLEQPATTQSTQPTAAIEPVPPPKPSPRPTLPAADGATARTAAAPGYRRQPDHFAS